MNVRHWDRERIFEKIFQEGPLGIALVGLDYHFFEVNQELCDLVGYTAEEMKGLKFTDITHPDDLNIDTQLAEQLFRGTRKNYQIEKRYIHKNGQIVPITLFAAVIRGDEGEPLYALAMILPRGEKDSRKLTPGALLEQFSRWLGVRREGRKSLGRICSWCNRVNTPEGKWETVEVLVKKSMDLDISHAMCEDCQKKIQAEG